MRENVADVQILKCQQVQHHIPSTVLNTQPSEKKSIQVNMLRNVRVI